MRFMCLYRAPEERTTPPSREEMAAMGKLVNEWVQAGALVSTEGLFPSAHGARVALEEGAFSATDGPFEDGAGVIGGYAIINAASKAEAIERAKAFLRVVGVGVSEVRQMYDQSPKLA